MSISDWANYIKNELVVNMPITTGKLDTNGNVGWVTVTFNAPFKSPPQIMLQGHVRQDVPRIEQVILPEMNMPTISIPEIEIPELTLPDATFITPDIPSFTVPEFSLEIQIPDWKSFVPKSEIGKSRSLGQYMYDEAYTKFRDNTSAFDWWPANAIRDGMVWPIAVLIQFVGDIITWVIDSFLWPRIEEINASLKEAKRVINDDIIGMGKWNDERIIVGYEIRSGGSKKAVYETRQFFVPAKANTINGILHQLRNSINAMVSDIVKGIAMTYDTIQDGVTLAGQQVESGVRQFRDKVNEAFDQSKFSMNEFGSHVRTKVESALNHSIDRLYEHMGILMPNGEADISLPLISPQIRNISLNGFQFYATGGLYDWIAVGNKVSSSDIMSSIDQGIKTLSAISPVPF